MKMNMKKMMMFAGMAAVLGACASPTGAKVPAELAPTDAELPALAVRARGVQIYECRAKTGSAPEWAFVAPDAELFDVRGRPMGHHGAGPVWEALDGSVIRGAVKARADAPVAGAIPWLLLSAKAEGPRGSFSHVSSIQRLNTVGGVAPSGGCDPKAIGKTARVGYTADYVFFSVRKRSGASGL
jgi:hypothetical protein